MKKAFIVFLILAVFLAQWLVLFNPVPPEWDGAFYYSYARSAVFDGDLHLVNDIELAYPTSGEQFASKQFEADLTATGHLNNVFAPGSALFWVPWLSLIRLSGWFVDPLPLTGYEQPIVTGAALTSALLVLVAFLLIYRRLALDFGVTCAILATITLMFTTPLLYYQFRGSFFSHAASAFVNTLVVLWWWRYHDRPMPWRHAFILGCLIGLAMLVRSQHIIYYALPLTSAIWWWLRQPHRKERTTWLPALSYLLITGIGMIAVFSIQLVLWKLYFGSWLTIPQGDSFIDWRALWLWPLLTSTFRGLLPWMPVTLPAMIGLLLLIRKRPRLALPLLLVLGLALYINASTRDWFGGGGYGPRRLASELAIWVTGYTALMAAIAPRLRWWIGGALGVLLTLHQWLLLRFGLELQLGGRVRSMSPLFKWEDQSWQEFGRKLMSLLPTLWNNPKDLFILNHSPLWRWQQQTGGLLSEFSIWITTTLLIAILIFGGRFFVNKFASQDSAETSN